MEETGKYVVGNVENGQFRSEQPAQMLRYGNTVCSGKVMPLEDGRMIRMDWSYMNSLHFGFCGQMGIPTALSLEKYNNTYYLQAFPIEEISDLYKNTNRYTNVKAGKETKVKIPFADAAHLVRLQGHFDETAVLDLVLFGRKIQIDFAENQISVGCNKAPVSITKKDLDITILIDRCSIELFSDGGKIYLYSLTEETLMDRNLLNLEMSCNQEYSLDFIEMHALETAW